MKVTHIRAANIIHTLPQLSGVVASSETFKSINRAKAASRQLQKQGGVVLREAKARDKR